MATTTIFRVEHTEHGRGPFTNLFSLPYGMVGDLCDRIGSLQNAVEDLGIGYDEVCGVSCPRGINRWFGYNMQGLMEHGYMLRRYILPSEKVRVGRDQVAFRKADAVSVEDLTLEQLTEIKMEMRGR